MISDKAKVLLLFSLLAISLFSFLTSKSFYTQNHGVGTLRINSQVTCAAPLSILQQCLQGNGPNSISLSQQDKNMRGTKTQCSDSQSQFKACQQVATKAYNYINLSACIRHIQATSICKVEWCSPSSSRLDGGESCERECKVVNEELKVCEKKYLNRFFHRAGLKADGTFENAL